MRILRLKQVQERTGLPRATVYRLVADGKFPRPYKLAAKAIGWDEEEVEAWSNSLSRATIGQGEAA